MLGAMEKLVEALWHIGTIKIDHGTQVTLITTIVLSRSMVKVSGAQRGGKESSRLYIRAAQSMTPLQCLFSKMKIKIGKHPIGVS